MKPTLLLYVVVFLHIIFQPTSGLSQWIHVQNPLGVYCLATNGTNVFAGTFDSTGVWLSTDNGASWTARGNSAFTGVYSLAFLGTNIFAGTYENGVWRSTDLGKSWAPANNGIAKQDIYGMAAIGSNLVAIGLGGIFQSTDSGANWKSTSDRYALESSATPLAVGGKYLYAATIGGLLRSADSGTSWITISDSSSLAVAANGSDVYTSNDSGFFHSSDNGDSWTRTSTKTFGLTYVYGKNIFAGPSRANDITCFVSTDQGSNWIDLNQNSRSTSLIVSGPNIIKGSNNSGIWYRPIPDFVAGVGKEIKSELNVSLFPNPTTGSVTIQSTSENIVHITISNLLGESVIELANPNSPEFTLDLSKLPPGTYFVRFALPSEVITRKILKE
jgi:photosystem II stability/assembly factor-like uncharacterized protein